MNLRIAKAAGALLLVTIQAGITVSEIRAERTASARPQTSARPTLQSRDVGTRSAHYTAARFAGLRSLSAGHASPSAKRATPAG